MRAALAQLYAAQRYAEDVLSDPWQFAVEMNRLLGLGASVSDLRWLTKKGYIEHACETTQPKDPARRFERNENLSFPAGTCFILASGCPFSFEELSEAVGGTADLKADLAPDGDSSPKTPRWAAEDRTLYVGDRIVKEYRVPSPNQEAVLSAFEEEGWPHYVDDPLPPVGDQNPKQRLRDTIKWLNTNQRNPLIRFHGDGTGERVGWKLANQQE